MNKRGVSLPLERLGLWIYILIAMILILTGLALYVFPKFNIAITKLFG
ncbi:hypothetical protein HY485_05320 [Candidatus Woesearchaeota archaeon]|nr:hypothetical protein [Candidatus Woesearchaeota archaeon]